VRALLAGAALLAAIAAPHFARADDPAPAPVPRPSPGVLHLSILGGFAHGSASFTETRTFTEFAEQGRIESRYEQDPGPGFEAGVGWRFARRLGVAAAVSFARRKEAGSFSAALPHPLFFGAPRRAAGDFAGRAQRETAVHLDLAVVGGAGRLAWTAFAGPSVIGIETDLVRTVEYTHAYPYDTVTVTGTPFASVSGNALGFNVGGGLAWPAAHHLAIETQVRFSRAKVGLEPTSDDRVSVDAGGTSFTVGLRLDF
jgi:opacity protein-like surface antigen